MAAARAVAKNDKLSLLPIDALVALGGDEEIPAAIITAVNAGRLLTAAQVKKALDKARPGDANRTGDHDSASPGPDEPGLPSSDPPATLFAELTAIWERADAETKTLFRQHIGCSGDFAPEQA